MFARTLSLKNKLVRVLAACVVLVAAAPVQASVVSTGHFVPLITAGAPPDSPDARIDPNLPASPFSGVVSINIRFDGASYICSGALVGRRQVISAGHCVDVTGAGTVIDLNAPGNDVRVVFNDGVANSVITASAVSLNPAYQGFGKCPLGVTAFCLNDDLSVITLGADAPASARIYKVAVNELQAGTRVTMAGYGTSGDGINGFTVGADFRIKRTGENYVDLFDGDDEQGFGGPREVWYADFDGAGQDTFCDFFDACSPQLPNNREAGIGGGDSGGPSFVNMYGELMLVANNTFGGWFNGQEPGTFGTYFGGVVLASYADYLVEATDGNITLVPEPAGLALFGLGLALLGARRRRAPA
ncbi:trypsin-like serine protease [Massilia sp. TSP1-1-2]|uniref:trypsin-like serine protease n=1 Tax=unclassified Massilia TaxID=2609279 RepID=UPI003CF96FF1